MKPALSAEEWRSRFLVRKDKGVGDDGRFSDGSLATREWHISSDGHQIFIGGKDEDGPWPVTNTTVPTAHHALAALCLHDQPFGFRREDVSGLRFLSESREGSAAGDLIVFQLALARLADRIEALLPPED